MFVLFVVFARFLNQQYETSNRKAVLAYAGAASEVIGLDMPLGGMTNLDFLLFAIDSIFAFLISLLVVLDMPFQIRAVNAAVAASSSSSSSSSTQLGQPLANCLGKLQLARLALRAVSDFYFSTSQSSVRPCLYLDEYSIPVVVLIEVVLSTR